MIQRSWCFGAYNKTVRRQQGGQEHTQKNMLLALPERRGNLVL